MRTLALSPLNRLAELAPLILRVVLGTIMAAHGWQKLQAGPANFGAALGQMGVPLPTLMGYVVTFVELVGAVLLIVGLLSRLAALVLTIDLVVAISLVKVHVGFLSPPQGGAGAELDLALIAGFLAILLPVLGDCRSTGRRVLSGAGGRRRRGVGLQRGLHGCVGAVNFRDPHSPLLVNKGRKRKGRGCY